MALQKRKKPTNKELVNAIMNNNQKINECINFINRVDNVLGLYIEYNKETKGFADYVIEKMKKAEKEKENDTKTNENLDRQDIQGDTESERAGAEGVREKGK